MQLPYIYMVIQGMDTPSIDYDSKKDKKKKQKLGFGTPIKDLPIDIQKQIR